MKVTKWVDLSQEVEVHIGADDIRCALAEAFAVVKQDQPGVELPDRSLVMRCFGDIASFLGAITDESISQMQPAQRKVIGEYLAKHAARYLESK